MAYRDDIAALSPDHIWRFDGDFLDSAGSLNGTNTGCVSAAAITEDATNSQQSNNALDRIALATAATVDQALTRKCIGGWVQISAIQPPPRSLYREGGTGNQVTFVCWAGNNLLLDATTGSTILQLLALQPLQPGRTYHVLFLFSGSGFDDTFELYVDGVLQDSLVPGVTELADRDVGEWADPSPTTDVGNQNVILTGCENCSYQYWAAWGNTTLPTATEIREELFEKGALPGVTIASDTEANMQIALDAIADTVRPDEPLNIRIEAVSGGGDFQLDADNITHDALASIHIQYMGTDTLTYVNLNGSNASIGSTPNGGTLNIVTPAVLTLTPLIANSEVRVYESGTTTELAGIENSGTSFAASINTNMVDVMIHSLAYENVRVNGVDMTGGDITLPISQVIDRQYENPA